MLQHRQYEENKDLFDNQSHHFDGAFGSGFLTDNANRICFARDYHCQISFEDLY